MSEVADLAAQTAELRAWKREASAVLDEWERVFNALGRPGPLGHSKPANVLEQVEALKALVFGDNEAGSHYQKRESGTCSLCGDVWPCRTFRLGAILNGYPDPEVR